jgi:hypothetical protein
MAFLKRLQRFTFLLDWNGWNGEAKQKVKSNPSSVLGLTNKNILSLPPPHQEKMSLD